LSRDDGQFLNESVPLAFEIRKCAFHKARLKVIHERNDLDI
jgi:hypothetical protein